MLPFLWQDTGVEMMGTPAVDAVSEDTFGAVYGTGAPYSGDFELPTNLDNYQLFTIVELVRRIFKRHDFYLSENLAVVEFPLTATFADEVSPESLRPMSVTVPAVPNVLGRRIVVNGNGKHVYSFSAIEASLWSEIATTFGAELTLDDGSVVTPTVVQPVAAGQWTAVRFLLPAGFGPEVINTIRVGPQAIPGQAYSFRIGRISMLYSVSSIPPPVVQSNLPPV
jgi:hypothetical protein